MLGVQKFVLLVKHEKTYTVSQEVHVMQIVHATPSIATRPLLIWVLGIKALGLKLKPQLLMLEVQLLHVLINIIRQQIRM